MDNNAVNVVAADLQNGTAAPSPAEPQTLADVIGASVEPAQQPAPNTASQDAVQQQEPGWFQGRLQKERAKWDAERQAELAPMIERQTALLERVIAQDAQALVSSGEFKSIERATEYLRMKEGLPLTQQPQQPAQIQPRDAQGRFVAPQQAPAIDPATQQRAAVLIAQAETIKATTGFDVMQIYNTNPEVKQKVINGEMDFNAVFKAHGNIQHPAVRHVPAPVRSSNGVALGDVNIRSMSEKEFASLNDFLSRNGKVNMS